MAQLDLANFITVTLLSALKGLADVNTSVLALFTDEEAIPGNYGTNQIYLDPVGVANDFGSSSDTYRLANQVFSQSPNILSGGGRLVVIPREQSAPASAATILSSSYVDLTKLTATDYKLHAKVDGGTAADIAVGSIDSTSLATALASLNNAAMDTAGLEFSITGSVTAAFITLKSQTTGATSGIEIGTASTGTDLAVPLYLSGVASGAAAGLETLKDAILRTYGSIAYFGVISNDYPTVDASILELARTVQTMDKLLFLASATSGNIAGIFTTIKNAALSHTRCLYYSTALSDALDYMASYAGRGLSINFDGSNTVHTMNGKQLVGIEADSGLTQTIVTACGNAGVDVYGNFGVARTLTSGENMFFDQIYTRLAFKLRLQIAGFNFLTTTNTKIPQTEEGMNGLKKAYRGICEKFVGNGTFAPGTWNSSTTYGDPEDHKRNIASYGYYIYSLPVAKQTQSEREARKAPAIYIAAKDSGAIHSSDVTVTVEA